MKFVYRVLLVLLAFLSSFPLPAQQTPPALRAITVDDYFNLREVRDPQIGPDGKWVSYTVKTAIAKEDKNEERLWMVPMAGGEPVALTAEGVSSSHGRWSPNGHFIAFLSA